MTVLLGGHPSSLPMLIVEFPELAHAAQTSTIQLFHKLWELATCLSSEVKLDNQETQISMIRESFLS